MQKRVKVRKPLRKSSKPIVVVSSDSEHLEVDFSNYHPNQPHQVPTNIPQEPNPPANAPVEEQQEQEQHVNDPIEVPVGDAEEPQNPGNLNLVPAQPPMLMANNQLNWSHFRPRFSGKPEEDVEAHLLRTEDWMTTHNFPEDQKVGRFCLTLMQGAKLWYATLNAQQQQLTWENLWDRFRQQYSKFGSTREQYFHALRSFQFYEATDTIDGYIHKVKQEAALLDYGEPQILELFKTLYPVDLIVCSIK